MPTTPPRIAVFGPHPDDQELGMGGTIIRLASQGCAVLLVDMTNGEPTPLGDPATRKTEAFAALDVMNRAAADAGGRRAVPIERICLGLPNRSVEHTLAARHLAAATIRAQQAQVVFVPYHHDAHPDHLAATRIVTDARFDAKLTKVDMPAPVCAWTGERLGGPGAVGGMEGKGDNTKPIYPKWLFEYYCTHLRIVADPSFVFDITGLVDAKIGAIEAYHTQFVLPDKNRRIVGWVRSAADYFGSRIGAAAGEPFHSPEPVGLGGVEGLVM